MKKLLTICATVAALASQAATNYVVPWYANPIATNVTYDASLVNDPADAAIAAKITAAWTAVSGATALAGKTAAVKTMGDTTYFRPKFYVLCTSGDIVEFTMAKDLSSAVWTNTLTAAKLAATAGASGTASDLKVSDDGRLAFLKYGDTWKALGYAAPTWRVITAAQDCPCHDKHAVMVDSTGTYVLHVTRQRNYDHKTPWKWNNVAIGTLLTNGVVAAWGESNYTDPVGSTEIGNGFCPDGAISEYLDLSSGVVTWSNHAYNIMANWEFALGVPEGGRTPRVIIHSPNLETINKIMGGWAGGYEEVVIDAASVPAGNTARTDQKLDGFPPSVKRLVLNVPNITPNAYGGFPYGDASGTTTNAAIASESRWEDFNFSNVEEFAGASFRNFDCGGTLDLPSVVKLNGQAFLFSAPAHENSTPMEIRVSPDNKTVKEIGTQAFAGQANAWRVVIGGHEDGVLFKGKDTAYPYQFLGLVNLKEFEFTGGLPLFEENMGNNIFPSSQPTKTFAFVVPRETKWTNFIAGSYRQATDAEIASYTASNPGRYVPFGVVTNRSLFHAYADQYVAYTDSFGKGAPIPLTVRFDETRGNVTTAVVQGNPADALGRYEEGTVLRFTVEPNAGVSFRRWYGDIGTNDATSATITVTAKKNLFLAARFVNSWTIEDYDSQSGTAKATDGNYKINISGMNASKHTFTLGSSSIYPYGLFDIEYIDNGDNTVTTNMLAGSSTLDLGGEFHLAGDPTPWVPTAFANVNYLASYPIAYRDTLLYFFSPGTITSEMKKPLFTIGSSGKTLSVCFETVVFDEPSMPGKLRNGTFAGLSRKAKNIVFILPSITEIEEKALWDAEPSNDLSTWDLSSVATVSPIGLTTQWYLSNENSYAIGRRAFDCYGDLGLPALRSVDAGVWTKNGVDYRAVAFSPMPYMTSLTLGGKTKADTVTNLCDGAFAGNSAMTNLTIHADENIVVGTGIFADHAGRDTVNSRDVVYPGHTPETITFTGVAPKSDIFANLLAGVGAGDAPVLIRVTAKNTTWFRRDFIDYKPTAAEMALANDGIAEGEKVLGVYRDGGIVKGVFVCNEALEANLATTVIFR